MNFRMVTLLVDPKQAEILQLAMLNGSISLSMRNPLDTVHDGQRLTRAREIAPNRLSGFGFSPRINPVADQKSPDETKADDDAAPASKASKPPMWETLIVRGAVSEKRSFPMSAAMNSDNSTAQILNRDTQQDARVAPAGTGG